MSLTHVNLALPSEINRHMPSDLALLVRHFRATIFASMPPGAVFLRVRASSALRALAAAKNYRTTTDMFRKLFSAFRSRPTDAAPEKPAGMYSPYSQYQLNYFYNLFFCDDLTLYRSNAAAEHMGVWRVLFAEPPDNAALLAVATNDEHEGRVRMLAFNRLRSAGVSVPEKVLLGVIVEVPLEEGLEVLAAFSDGGVRYLNSAGKVAVVEGGNSTIAPVVEQVLAAAQPIVDRIGPWQENRLPPPEGDRIRFTFLVSDGLYFGEGPLTYMQRDDMAGPLWSKATELLTTVVNTVLAAQQA